MAVRLVQTKSTAKTTSSSSSTNVWTYNTTTGNFIVVLIICDSLTANPVSTVTDSQSNTYNKIFSTTTNGVVYSTIDVWVAYNITGGTTPTITATLGASQITGIIAREYAGIPTTAVVDQYVSTPITTLSLRMPSAPTSLTTSPYELAIAVVGDGDGSNTFNPANGFVNGVSLDIGSTFGCGMADKILTGITTENAHFNATPNTTQGVVGLITIPAIKDKIITSRIRPNPFVPGLAR